jgi:hypothetical protein
MENKNSGLIDFKKIEKNLNIIENFIFDSEEQLKEKTE